MELREFVARSLSDIVQGVRDAQAQIADSGAQLNPTLRNVFTGSTSGGAVLGWSHGQGGVPVLLADFDVAVTATEGTQTQGGIGVVAGIVALGSKGQSDQASSSASRIRFSVPLLLPTSPARPAT